MIQEEGREGLTNGPFKAICMQAKNIQNKNDMSFGFDEKSKGANRGVEPKPFAYEQKRFQIREALYEKKITNN